LRHHGCNFVALVPLEKFHAHAAICHPMPRNARGSVARNDNRHAERRLADVAEQATIHRRLAVSTELPLSFVYGGRSSSGLVAAWKRTFKEQTLDATRSQCTLTAR